MLSPTDDDPPTDYLQHQLECLMLLPMDTVRYNNHFKGSEIMDTLFKYS